MCKKLLLTSTLLLLSYAGMYAQTLENGYTPVQHFKAPPTLIKDAKTKFTNWPKKSTLKNRNAIAEFTRLTKEKGNFIYSLDTAGYIMYSDSISQFLNTIAHHITLHNPLLLGKEFQCFTYREASPNAFSLGEGIVMLSTGLLARLRTVDEIAFVLSHEISHDVLNHVFNSMQEMCEAMHDKELKRTLRKISKLPYGQHAELEKIMRSFNSGFIHTSQSNELQADSLGYVLFGNAGYSLTAAVSVMHILDSSDYFLHHDTLDLRKIFNLDGYPFKSYWMQQDNSTSLWERDSTLYDIPDSLKTHPNCKTRIAYINNYEPIVTVTSAKNSLSTAYTFHRLNKPIFGFENLQSLMHETNYATAMYVSLHMQQQYPNNLYLKCVVAECLYELALALMNSEYSSYVAFPDESYCNGYNQLLTFLQNMNSSTLKNLFSFYYKQHIATAPANNYTAYLQLLHIHLESPEMNMVPETEKYITTYTDKVFTKKIKKNLSPKKKKK